MGFFSSSRIQSRVKHRVWLLCLFSLLPSPLIFHEVNFCKAWVLQRAQRVHAVYSESAWLFPHDVSWLYLLCFLSAQGWRHSCNPIWRPPAAWEPLERGQRDWRRECSRLLSFHEFIFKCLHECALQLLGILKVCLGWLEDVNLLFKLCIMLRAA